MEYCFLPAADSSSKFIVHPEGGIRIAIPRKKEANRVEDHQALIAEIRVVAFSLLLVLTLLGDVTPIRSQTATGEVNGTVSPKWLRESRS
jgi:hypothetical protein